MKKYLTLLFHRQAGRSVEGRRQATGNRRQGEDRRQETDRGGASPPSPFTHDRRVNFETQNLIFSGLQRTRQEYNLMVQVF